MRLLLAVAASASSVWLSTPVEGFEGAVAVASAKRGGTLRHCRFQLFASGGSPPADDHRWQLVPGLDKAPNSTSFQSVNFPAKYVGLTGEPEANRLGIDTPDGRDPALFSFDVKPVTGSDTGAVTIRSRSRAGGYVTLSANVTGLCAAKFTSDAQAGNAVLATPAAPLGSSSQWVISAAPGPPAPPAPPTPGPETVTVHVDNVTHTVSPLALGCHSDSGYSHQARGFYAQMIVGDSFLATGYDGGRWNNVSAQGARVSVALNESERFFNTSSTTLALESAGCGSCSGGISNRGLGNAGLVFEAGKEYDGVLIARAAGATEVTVTVSVSNHRTGVVLAQTTLTVPPQAPSGAYSKLNFTLTPSGSTSCWDVSPGEDPTVFCGKPITTIGHTCQACGGEFAITLSKAGASVHLNYVLLQPGQWGRVQGLPVLASAAENLRAMGIRAIRQGGSFASGAPDSAAYYDWEKWTGPAWTRPSRANGVWKSCLLAGWGPFEMIDMCNALNIEPVITTSEADSPAEFANLVEYAWGNASTPMGAKRAADGHPAPYRVRYIELGNEQYNTNYVDQVAAMEAKAAELGMSKTLYYMFPQNGFLNQGGIARAKQLNLPAEHLLADLHVGAGGAVEEARALFAKNSGFNHGAVNAETNARIHTHQRALSEAQDLNDWFNAADVVDRLHFRTASFCAGDATDFDAWDQGISFFLPNMTWLQPPGYVHQMIDQTFQPRGLGVSTSRGGSASAQLSLDNRTLVVRYVNQGAAPVNVTFVFGASGRSARGGAPGLAPATATVMTLSASDLDAANPPGNPTVVSPTNATVHDFRSGSVLTVPGYSYTVVVLPVSTPL